MKRWMGLVLFLLFSAGLFAYAETVFGTVSYVENNVTVVRAGKPQKRPLDIGDDVFPEDMIKTEKDSYIVIDLDRSTGMRGSLTIKQGSIAYLNLATDPGKPKTTIDLIAGQIGSKLTKLSGSPSFDVNTETAVMGVRGTQFNVYISITGGILVICTEGSVNANDGTSSVNIPAGNAAEKQPDQRMRLNPVAITAVDEYARKWFADAIEAFKASPLRALQDYEKRYTDLSTRFNTAFDPLQRSEVLSKWLREDADGLVPSSNSIEVLQEKKAIMPHIMNVQKVLFFFERIYYRLLELQDIVSGTSTERSELRPGLTVADFLRRLKADGPVLERKVNLFRQAEYLYGLRNQGGLLGSSLFDSDDGWDF